MADAALVATRAEDALVLAVFRDAPREVGVGDQRARHADGIRRAGGQQCLRLGRLVDARGGYQRHGELCAQDARRLAHRVARDRRGRHDPGRPQIARRIADHGARVVDQTFVGERAQDARALRGMAALRQRLVGGQPYAHGHARAGAATHRAQCFAHVVETPLSIAAPGVVAPVRALAQELRGQVAVRCAQLESVEPGLARVACHERVVLDDLLDLV